METKKVINDSIHVSELKEYIEQGLTYVKRSGAGICLIFRPEKEKVFTEKDLVSFGNYLLSEKREKLLKNHGNLNDETVRMVHHSDLENWKLLK